ncbi:hypothetical protein [Burkholderia ambifaria]|uniref:hypothetical protein n=1 Tax=Burkholderia ambifaria TaxID=152480 RepID=UPI00158BF194|nr:hypothetical protein [Burkholderia ambifaria]
MAITTVSAALGALKATIDLVQGAINARDQAKLADAKQLLNDRIIDVQNAALQLQEKQSSARDEIEALKDELRTTKAKLVELEDRNADRSKYKLKELAPANFAYSYVPESEDGTPTHYICQPCMDGMSKKYVLKELIYWGVVNLKCPNCENEIDTGERR